MCVRVSVRVRVRVGGEDTDTEDVSVMPWRGVGVDMCDLLHYFLSGRLILFEAHHSLLLYSPVLKPLIPLPLPLSLHNCVHSNTLIHIPNVHTGMHLFCVRVLVVPSVRLTGGLWTDTACGQRL